MPAPRTRRFSPARHWFAVFFSILALSAVPLFAAAEEIIYAWTDDEGVRHYAARPPLDRDYQIVRTMSGTSEESEPVREAQPADPPAPLAAVAETEPDPDLVDERCEQARANLDLLTQDRPALLRDEDGEATPLDDERRQQLVEETEAFIEEWC